MIDIEELIDLLEKDEINSDQFLLVYLFIVDDLKNLKKFLKLKEKRNEKFTPEQLKELEDKDIIINHNENGFDTANIIINPKYSERFTVDEEEAGDEIWQCYFKWLFINGREVPAKSMDYDEFINIYSRIIKNSKTKHQRILNITKNYVNSRKYAEMGIEKYIRSRYYDEIESKYLRGNDSPQRDIGEII